MELKKALQLHTEYSGMQGIIRVGNDDFICLNEMAAFFPYKSLDKWMKAEHAKEFIAAVESSYQLPPNGGIKTKRGNMGGTWAHPMVAFEFATWLSPEFKIKVYREYIEGTQTKKDWNIKRILASNNYKMMCDSIKSAHDEPKPYHYSNESRMINAIIFSEPSFDRDNANESQLEDISWLESRNGACIDLGMDYQQRKAKLTELYLIRSNKLLENAIK
jgi:hypothetical protein